MLVRMLFLYQNCYVITFYFIKCIFINLLSMIHKKQLQMKTLLIYYYATLIVLSDD